MSFEPGSSVLFGNIRGDCLTGNDVAFGEGLIQGFEIITLFRLCVTRTIAKCAFLYNRKYKLSRLIAVISIDEKVRTSYGEKSFARASSSISKNEVIFFAHNCVYKLLLVFIKYKPIENIIIALLRHYSSSSSSSSSIDLIYPFASRVSSIASC